MHAIDPATLHVHSPLALRLRDHTAYLASPELGGRKPGTPGHRAAATYITTHYARAGLEPLTSLGGYSQTINAEIGDNLIGAKRAATPMAPERWILVGAHYDHLGTIGNKIYAGADDNAAAVSILLELAGRMPPLQHHSLLFAAFNAEEPPYALLGSQYFVDHLPQEIGSPRHLQTAVILELMGGVHWAPLAPVVFAAGAEQSPGLYRHILAERPQDTTQATLSVQPLGMHVIEEIPLIGRTPFSDYDAFRRAEVPFLFLSAGRTPRYHQPTDLPDTLHYERMALTTTWLANLLYRIDDDRRPYEWIPDRICLADEIATLHPLIQCAARRETGIPGTSLASRLKLQADAAWLSALDPAQATTHDLKRLERASLRMQALLSDFGMAFLL